MKNISMSEALQRATDTHERRYPGSKAYDARISARGDEWLVEVACRYTVPRTERYASEKEPTP